MTLITVSACDDAAAPEPLVPFEDARYALVAIDGHALPAAFEHQGSTYLVTAGTLEFVDDTTVSWMLEDLTPVPPETVPLESISGTSAYRQPARDSLEIGGADLGAFTVSPWAYGRRTGEMLDVRTVDPVPSDPRVPDLAYSPLGLHLWRFERSE